MNDPYPALVVACLFAPPLSACAGGFKPCLAAIAVCAASGAAAFAGFAVLVGAAIRMMQCPPRFRPPFSQKRRARITGLAAAAIAAAWAAAGLPLVMLPPVIAAASVVTLAWHELLLVSEAEATKKAAKAGRR